MSGKENNSINIGNQEDTDSLNIQTLRAGEERVGVRFGRTFNPDPSNSYAFARVDIWNEVSYSKGKEEEERQENRNKALLDATKFCGGKMKDFVDKLKK